MCLQNHNHHYIHNRIYRKGCANKPHNVSPTPVNGQKSVANTILQHTTTLSLLVGGNQEIPSTQAKSSKKGESQSESIDTFETFGYIKPFSLHPFVHTHNYE